MIGSKVWLIAAIAVAGVASGAASAQGNLKIGVVNVARLVEQSPQFADGAEEARGRVRSAATRPRGDAAKAAHAAGDVPARCARHGRRGARSISSGRFATGQREFQRTENEFVEDFNLRRNEELGKLQRDVLLKAQEYARAQKFDLLLADQSIIFASTAVDITEAVLTLPESAGAPLPAR